MKNNFKSILTSIFITVLFLGTIVWADTNGIWHLTKDVMPGTFGADEGDTSTSYIFQNPVSFTNSLIYKGTELDAKYVNENQANSITSAMITDGQVTNNDVNFNYATSGSKGGSATNSNSCNADGICEITTGTISSELKVNTIRSNGNGNVVIIVG